jgi:hypothetical protein
MRRSTPLDSTQRPMVALPPPEPSTCPNRVRIPGWRTYGRLFVIAHNRFVNNWAGIIAWENPDRFAGSPANSSGGYTTLVNPEVATVEACAARRRSARSHTSTTAAGRCSLCGPRTTGSSSSRRGCLPCTHSSGCRFQGLVSSYGTYLSWSPYKGVHRSRPHHPPSGESVGGQHLHRSVALRGPRARARRVVVDVAWRGVKYGQDSGSTRC